MLTGSYHVVSSESGFVRCLATVGPTLGTNFCHIGFVDFPLCENLACALGPQNGRHLTLLMLLDIIIYLVLWL